MSDSICRCPASTVHGPVPLVGRSVQNGRSPSSGTGLKTEQSEQFADARKICSAMPATITPARRISHCAFMRIPLQFNFWLCDPVPLNETNLQLKRLVGGRELNARVRQQFCECLHCRHFAVHEKCGRDVCNCVTPREQAILIGVRRKT